MNKRIEQVQEYHFKSIDSLKNKLIASGKEIIDLSIGDPDLEVHPNILNKMIEKIMEMGTNKYPPYDGIRDLKEKVIEYYNKNFKVQLNEDEVLILIGSKEGLNNLIPATCDIGDLIIVPELSYPVYEKCALLWGCKTYRMELLEENNYLPNLNKIPKSVREKSKLLYINYPNNPSGATATREFYEEIIQFCNKNNILLCNDAAYMEIIKDKEEKNSLLQFDSQKRTIEIGSFSKTYNMTGFRIGYAVGNSSAISLLTRLKSNVDSGQYIPIQYSAVEALNLGNEYIENIRRIYDERRNIAYNILDKKGIKYYKGKGTFYIWCYTPNGVESNLFVSEVMDKYGVIFTPGSCFGEKYRNYFRIALTTDKDSIQKGLEKLENIGG